MDPTIALNFLSVGKNVGDSIVQYADRKRLWEQGFIYLRDKYGKGWAFTHDGKVVKDFTAYQASVPISSVVRDIAKVIVDAGQIDDELRVACADLCLCVLWLIIDSEGFYGFGKVLNALDSMWDSNNTGTRNYAMCKDFMHTGELDDLKKVARGYDLPPSVWRILKGKVQQMMNLNHELVLKNKSIWGSLQEK